MPRASPPRIAAAARRAYALCVARYVIDAATLLHVLDRGARFGDAHRLVAPNAIRSAVLEMMLADVRSGQRDAAAVLEIHERLTEVPMRLLGDRVSRRTAWRIACEHENMSLRDAEYVAIARLQADGLVTIDPALAALAAPLVPLAPLSAVLADGSSGGGVGPRRGR